MSHVVCLHPTLANHRTTQPQQTALGAQTYPPLQLVPVYTQLIRQSHHPSIINQTMQLALLAHVLFCCGLNGRQTRQVKTKSLDECVWDESTELGDRVLGLCGVAGGDVDFCALLQEVERSRFTTGDVSRGTLMGVGEAEGTCIPLFPPVTIKIFPERSGSVEGLKLPISVYQPTI